MIKRSVTHTADDQRIPYRAMKGEEIKDEKIALTPGLFNNPIEMDLESLEENLENLMTSKVDWDLLSEKELSRLLIEDVHLNKQAFRNAVSKVQNIDWESLPEDELVLLLTDPEEYVRKTAEVKTKDGN